MDGLRVLLATIEHSIHHWQWSDRARMASAVDKSIHLYEPHDCRTPFTPKRSNESNERITDPMDAQLITGAMKHH